MKVYIKNNYDENASGGIPRVTNALIKYLPEFGIQVVHKPDEADVLNIHAGEPLPKRSNKPIVANCHGLYWSPFKWVGDHYKLNELVVNNMKAADVIVSPSDFVTQAVTRGIFKRVETIRHGIDVKGWAHSGTFNRNAIMAFPKNRIDSVCNPKDAFLIARKMQNSGYVFSTTANVKGLNYLGIQPYAAHKQNVKNSALYLALILETGDIGSMEAMAAGVPVVGWNWGATGELVKNDAGILVPVGNFDLLEKAIVQVMTNRDYYSRNAVKLAQEYEWRKFIGQYAELFKELYESNLSAKRLSVLITSYNVEGYIGRAINSAEKVLRNIPNSEIVIVDDGSKDKSASEIKQELAKHSNSPVDFVVDILPENFGVSAAKNHAFKLSSGRYVMFLDGDDVLLEINELIKALDQDRTLHGAYGALRSNNKILNWPAQFNYQLQLAHMNQVPYCVLMRRGLFEEVGGFRQRLRRGEDAETWLRASSFGYRFKKVTLRPAIDYTTNRANSISRLEPKNIGTRDSRWTAWFPFKLADSLEEGKEMKAHRIANVAAPFGSPLYNGTPVPTFHSPYVSVVVALGSGHEKYLLDCLDSVMAQTMRSWEVLVYNDTPNKLSRVKGAPYARIINREGNTIPVGPSIARNEAVRHARGTYVIFLDADDFLYPQALHYLLLAASNCDNPLVYGDLVRSDTGYFKTESALDGRSPIVKGRRPVTFLIKKDDFLRLGGFRPDLALYEDWEFEIRADHDELLCPIKIDYPIFYYRMHSGFRRVDKEKKRKAIAQIKELHIEKEVQPTMAERKCGKCEQKKLAALQKQLGALGSQDSEPMSMLASMSEVQSTKVPEGTWQTGDIIVYQGSRTVYTYTGRVTGRRYRFSKRAPSKVIGEEVDRRDLPVMLRTIHMNRPAFVVRRRQVVEDLKQAVESTAALIENKEYNIPALPQEEEELAVELPFDGDFTVKQLKETTLTVEQAERLLELEYEKEKPRTTAVKWLLDIINPQGDVADSSGD